MTTEQIKILEHNKDNLDYNVIIDFLNKNNFFRKMNKKTRKYTNDTWWYKNKNGDDFQVLSNFGLKKNNKIIESSYVWFNLAKIKDSKTPMIARRYSIKHFNTAWLLSLLETITLLDVDRARAECNIIDEKMLK
jgi:hypothetical protein